MLILNYVKVKKKSLNPSAGYIYLYFNEAVL